MKDTQSWISMLIAAGYMIFKLIISFTRKETELITKSDWEDEEVDLEEDTSLIKDLIHPANPTNKENTLIKPSHLTKGTIDNNKRIENFSYPGVKKLLLPTQEQN